MDAITFWTAFAAVAAALAFLLSLLAFLQGRERVIGWASGRSNVREKDLRIENTSRGLVAEVIALGDNFVDPHGKHGSMIYFAPTVPVEVLPQNWIPIGAHQILSAEPIAIKITWRQKRVGAKNFGSREYTASVFL